MTKKRKPIIPEQQEPAEQAVPDAPVEQGKKPCGCPDDPEPVQQRTVSARGGYIGPEYKYGIVIPGDNEMIRPREMSPTEQLELIRRYPPAAGWWQ